MLHEVLHGLTKHYLRVYHVTQGDERPGEILFCEQKRSFCGSRVNDVTG